MISNFRSPHTHTHTHPNTHTHRVGLCKGKFPDFLMEAWDEYDFRKKSDNDRPGGRGLTTTIHTNIHALPSSLPHNSRVPSEPAVCCVCSRELGHATGQLCCKSLKPPRSSVNQSLLLSESLLLSLPLTATILSLLSSITHLRKLSVF